MGQVSLSLLGGEPTDSATQLYTNLRASDLLTIRIKPLTAIEVQYIYRIIWYYIYIPLLSLTWNLKMEPSLGHFTEDGPSWAPFSKNKCGTPTIWRSYFFPLKPARIHTSGCFFFTLGCPTTREGALRHLQSHGTKESAADPNGSVLLKLKPSWLVVYLLWTIWVTGKDDIPYMTWNKNMFQKLSKQLPFYWFPSLYHFFLSIFWIHHACTSLG